MGGGITGLTIAAELNARGLGRICVLEKESTHGAHASGRNSGILHAGIYYSPGTLKARFCAEGNRRMVEFCERRGLKLVRSGKVVVARNAPEVKVLHQMKALADESGLAAQLLTVSELAQLEPHARTHEVALHSPHTATIDPREVLRALAGELQDSSNVSILRDTAFVGLRADGVAVTTQGQVRFRGLINAAGAHAARIAHAFGAGMDYLILPFKGAYKRLVPARAHLVRGNIYPVPDMRNPFLGVHLSKSVGGEVYVGPTATPALGPDAYSFRQLSIREGASILARDVRLLADPAFRTAALKEPAKYLSRGVLRQARALVPEIRADDLVPSEKMGIRAQVVHWPSKKLEMDFVLIKEDGNLHVLNAVSPAFTSSLAFAEHAVSVYESQA